MATPGLPASSNYTDQTGKPLDDNIDTWFARGVKPPETSNETKICTNQQTLYILLFAISFLIFLIVIIVPSISGSLANSGSG